MATVTLKWYDESLRGKLYEGAALALFPVSSIAKLHGPATDFKLNELSEYVKHNRWEVENLRTVCWANREDMREYFDDWSDFMRESFQTVKEMVHRAEDGRVTPAWLLDDKVFHCRRALVLCGFTATEFELLLRIVNKAQYPDAQNLFQSMKQKIADTEAIYIAKQGESRTFKERTGLAKRMARLGYNSALFFLFVLVEKLTELYQTMLVKEEADGTQMKVRFMSKNTEEYTPEDMACLKQFLKKLSPCFELQSEIKTFKGMYFDDSGGVTIGRVRLEFS